MDFILSLVKVGLSQMQRQISFIWKLIRIRSIIGYGYQSLSRITYQLVNPRLPGSLFVGKWGSCPKYCIGSDSRKYTFVGGFGLPDLAGGGLIEG